MIIPTTADGSLETIATAI